MSVSDPNRTRTAELAQVPLADGPPTRHRWPLWSEQTETLPDEELDGAAVSFARERERVLARLDHSASVRRLRRAASIGLPLWAATVLLDLFVIQVTHEGSWETFLTFRGIGLLVIAATILRLRREPEPSVPALWFYDVLTFTTAAACVSYLSLSYRGIESPYAPGVVLVLLARGATTLAPWQQGAWLFAVPGLAYPTVVLLAAQFNERIAAQLQHPQSLGNLASNLYMIVIAWAMLVFGGHFAWRMRREAIQTRNIGRYKLLRRLGSGGGGDVWAAIDTTLRQHVALKTVSGHRPGSRVLARLAREVRALAELTHPNTVRIFDHGVTDDGLWYYTMELLHGDNLRELVTRDGPLTPERLVRIALQVLRALGEAHGKGIIHRDIKPENVFVAQLGTEIDVIKLLDFGIARTSGDTQLTHTGFVTGTPAYIAPEIIVGSAADVRSDIYSFGATLHFALTGCLPFRDQDPAALFAAHLSRPLGPMSLLSPSPIPAALEHVVQHCMAKDPAERYASTQMLMEALEAAAPGHFAERKWPLA